MKMKILSAIIALCLLVLTITGCGNKVTTIATVNGVEVPIGYYTAQMMQTRVQLEFHYGDDYDSFMAQPNEADPTKTNAEYYNDMHKQAFELVYLFSLKVKELGLTMDEYRLSYFDSEYEYFKQSFNSLADYRLFLRKANLTEEEHKQIYMESTYYSDLIYAYFFDPDTGMEKLPEKAVRDYFDAYVDYSIQHILFSNEDDQALTQAQNVLDRLQANDITFADAMDEYSDDADFAYYPYGYGFLENEEGYPAVFTEAAKELAVGEYKIYESDLGYHIIKRISNDSYFENMQDVYRKAYGTEKMQEKYAAWLDELTIVYNQEALDAFNFANGGRTNVNLVTAS